MKRIVLVFTAVVLTVSGFAQKTADIGVWGGSSTYWGDMKEVPLMQGFNPNFGAYFRYNFNKRVALRAMFLTGKFSAEGQVEGFQDDVPWNFSKGVQDLSFMIEVNYLKYLLGEKKTPFTPYIMGGVGVMYFPYNFDPALLAQVNPEHPEVGGGIAREESTVSATIPFGFGIKFNAGSRWGIGAEYQLRKMMSDQLDDLDDPRAFGQTNNEGVTETIKYTDFLHNNDWPGYFGLHVTYKIYMNQKACPAYDRKYW